MQQPQQVNCVVGTGYELVKAQLSTVRPTLEGISSTIFPCGGPQQQTLIEICGDSNTGKTLLLCQIIAYCLSPEYAGGRDVNVVLIDNDHHFSIKKLMHFIRNVIEISNKSTSTTDMNTMVAKDVLQKSLDSLQIIPCHSSLEYMFALNQVEELLLANDNIAFVAIDGLDTFYWEDNYHDRQSKSSHFRNNLSKLKKLCDTFKVTIAYTIDDKLMFNENLLNNTQMLSGTANSNAGNNNNNSLKADYTIHMRKLENNNKIMLNEREVVIDNCSLKIKNN